MTEREARSQTETRKSYTLDRYEHTTAVAALIHYALHAADPTECIRCLNTLVPEPLKPWDEIITEGRAKWDAIARNAEARV